MNSFEYYEKLLKKWFPFIIWNTRICTGNRNDTIFNFNKSKYNICWYNKNTNILYTEYNYKRNPLSKILDKIFSKLIERYI